MGMCRPCFFPPSLQTKPLVAPKETGAFAFGSVQESAMKNGIGHFPGLLISLFGVVVFSFWSCSYEMGKIPTLVDVRGVFFSSFTTTAAGDSLRGSRRAVLL